MTLSGSGDCGASASHGVSSPKNKNNNDTHNAGASCGVSSYTYIYGIPSGTHGVSSPGENNNNNNNGQGVLPLAPIKIQDSIYLKNKQK
jgi:hypothetical protein